MKPKNYEVLMDIYMGVLNAPAIQFTTEDFGMCQITFSLLEDRITPYNLSNCIVRMVINGQQQDCTISDANNGKAEIVLLQSMFSEVGPVFAELQIYDATNQTMRLTTPTFKYTVRKSLMDDNTAQADPNYSILQNMILEVSSADEVAKQAKKTAESAMATANQAESKADQIMSNGDYAKEQGDYAKAEGDRLQGMLTLDGAPQTKFDFIKNQVVKDGLIEYVNKKITGAHVVNKLDISNDFTLVGCIRNYNKTTLWYVPNVGQMRLVVDAQSNKLTINGFEDRRILETDATPIIEFAVIKQGSRFTISINGIIAVTDLKYADEDIINKWNTNKFSFGYNSATLEVEYTCNNRALAQQEIQHIFSVINNTPSIKELHTTNAEGETIILKLASDTDHVEDRSGRTQEEINRTFYKRMCKEIPSPNGEPITVKNGEEGYVLSAEIKGNTQLFKRAKGSQDEWIVIPNDEGRDTVAFEYKLDSTQAIISNNGEPYPIYANEEDETNKKVISLPFPEDKLILNEDGSATWIDASNRKTLNNNEPWIKSSVQNAEANCFQIEIIDADNNGNSVIVFCDKLESVTGASTLSAGTLKPNTCGIDGSRYLRVGVPKTVDTVEQMKEFAQNLNIIYRSKIQEITHIDKSLAPTILTHKTNILEAGGAVKPSSFKVTVPVDKLAEIEARLQALESTTVDVVLNK